MEPLVGEIKMFAGNFAPNGWFTCEGQTLPINQYTALYSLLGTVYGGDGMQTFQLPDLRSQAPIQATNIGRGKFTSYFLGQTGGQEQVTLTAQQMPAHSHSLNANATTPNQGVPTNNFIGYNSNLETGDPIIFHSDKTDTVMNPASIGVAGGNQPVNITSPVLAVNFIIAWQGIFPSRP